MIKQQLCGLSASFSWDCVDGRDDRERVREDIQPAVTCRSVGPCEERDPVPRPESRETTAAGRSDFPRAWATPDDS